MSSPADENILDEASLTRYAEALVNDCLRISHGDTLLIQGQPAHRALMVALAEAAYRMGARLVEPVHIDLRMLAARVRYGSDEALGEISPWAVKRLREQLRPTTAVLNILGDADPDAFEGLPPARIAEDQTLRLQRVRWYTSAVRAARVRWVAGAWPTKAWASRVYPDRSAKEAQQQLAHDLLWFSYLHDNDRQGAWSDHIRALSNRAEALTKLQLHRLEIRAEGTELALRLAPGTNFSGGELVTPGGTVIAPNMPTDECYTTPDAAGTEGTFRCAVPLSLHGRLIEGIAGEFRNGRIVRLETSRDEDRDFLAAFLDRDPRARRLGEVGLVDRTSRIAKSGRCYFNTLIDENAATHIAFGSGFAYTRSEDSRPARGVNQSSVHIDVMIGTSVDVEGVDGSGRRIPLIIDGQWNDLTGN